MYYQVISITIFVQLLYSISFLQLRESHKSQIQRMKKHGLFFDLLGFAKVFQFGADEVLQLPKQDSTIANIGGEEKRKVSFWTKVLQKSALLAVYLVMGVIPVVLGLTIYGVFKQESVEFSLKIPQLSLSLVAQFLASIALHELGHYAAARMLGSKVRGVGVAWKAGLPQVFIKVDEPSPERRRLVTAGGPLANLLVALGLLLLSWALFLCVKVQAKSGVTFSKESNSFRKFDSLTELAGQAIYNKQQFSQLVPYLKKDLFKDKYILFDNNHQIKGDAQPDTQTYFQIGAKKLLSTHAQPGSGYAQLTQKYVNGKVVYVVQPVQLSIQQQAELGGAEHFCDSSVGQLCVLPEPGKNGIRFYISAIINGEFKMLETDFDELENLELMNGSFQRGLLTGFYKVASWMAVLASVNFGILITSLLPIPRHSDGAVVLGTGIWSTVYKSLIVVQLLVVAVAVVVKRMQN